MVSAANMSPVPEKKSGSSGVSIRKRRGLKSDVAVDPMMVIFRTCSSSSNRCGGEGALDASGFCGSDPASWLECEAGCIRAGSM